MNPSLSKATKQLFFVLFIFILTFTYFQFFSGVKVVAAPTPPVCQPITTTINQAPAQIDPTGSFPVKFKVVFSSPITPSTFTPAQIELTGTAPGKSVTGITEIAPNDGTTFEVSVVTTGNGSVVAGVKEVRYAFSYLGPTGKVPSDIVLDNIGNVYTANLRSNNVTKITPSGVSSILATTGDGPFGINIDQSGNIYTANTFSNTVSKITPSGVSSIFGATDTDPTGIILDQAGNVYTANRNALNITKISSSGVSSIFATTGLNNYRFVVDQSGNLYTSNVNANSVSKITPSGVVTNLGSTGNQPFDIAIDQSGNIYTANFGSSNVTKFSSNGTISTLSINGTSPYGIAVDLAGNIYTANYGSGNVSKTTPAGIASNIGSAGGTPISLEIDISGNLYTSNSNYQNQDTDNVTKLTKTGASLVLGCTVNNQLATNFAQPSTSTDNIVTIDTTPPPITGIPDLATASDTGASSTDDITNDTTPPFDIPCQAGSTVTIYNYSNPLASKLCPVENTVSITLTTPLIPGNYLLSARQTNPLGVLSDISGLLSLTIDTTAPAAPVVNALATSTNQNPTITGQCEGGLGLTVTFNPTNETLSTICDYLNTFTITPTTQIPTGPYTVSITQKDIAGNSSLLGLANGTISAPIDPALDTDGDKVPDSVEITDGTNPNDIFSYKDTDGDLVPDYIETIQGTITNSKFDYLDTDKDLIPDYIEERDSTDKNDKTSFKDTDTGGTPDYVETIVFPSNGLLATSTSDSSDDRRDFDNDGLGDYQEFILGSSPLNPDSDLDGISDSIEGSGPNNGDFNSDGIPDFNQFYIRGQKGTNNEFVGFVSDYSAGYCYREGGGLSTQSNKLKQNQIKPQALTNSTILDGIPESTLSAQDSTYSYPKGLIKYIIECLTPGTTTNVTLYFSNQTDSPNLKVRKYKNGTYSDLPGATKTQITLGGLPTVKVTYDITDGGELDEDGLANGEIVDPVGLALLDTPVPPVTPTNPATGNGGTNTNTQPTTQTTTKPFIGLIRTGGGER
jgi:streptogramin lyase